MTESSLPAVLPPPAAPRPSYGLWIFSLIFLVLLFAMGWEMRNMRQHQKTELIKLDAKFNLSQQSQLQEFETLSENFSTSKQRISNNLNEHQARLNDFSDRQQALQLRLQSLSPRSLDNRRVLEAYLLIKQANLRLVLAQDIPSALILLQEADELLRNTGTQDAPLLQARQTLNQHLTALKLIPDVDKNGLYLKLNTLQTLIPSLPLQPSPPTAPTEPPSSTAPDKHSRWTQWFTYGWQQFQQHLKHYIRVEDHSDSLKPLLNQETAQLIQLTLRLHLEQAQSALLSQNSQAFQLSLTDAQQLLDTYFWPSPALGEYKQSLAELQTTPLSPALPSLSDCLQQLQAYQQQASQPEVISAPSLPTAEATQ